MVNAFMLSDDDSKKLGEFIKTTAAISGLKMSKPEGSFTIHKFEDDGEMNGRFMVCSAFEQPQKSQDLTPATEPATTQPPKPSISGKDLLSAVRTLTEGANERGWGAQMMPILQAAQGQLQQVKEEAAKEG